MIVLILSLPQRLKINTYLLG